MSQSRVWFQIAHIDNPLGHLYLGTLRPVSKAWLTNGKDNPLGGFLQPSSHTCARLIERTPHCQSALGEDMSIDHRRFPVLVAEEFLDGSDIISLFQESGSEGVSKGMAASVLWNS